jgi:hypothetical protein
MEGLPQRNHPRSGFNFLRGGAVRTRTISMGQNSLNNFLPKIAKEKEK